MIASAINSSRTRSLGMFPFLFLDFSSRTNFDSVSDGQENSFNLTRLGSSCKISQIPRV